MNTKDNEITYHNGQDWGQDHAGEKEGYWSFEQAAVERYL
jgi:hypothetical protein